MNTYTSTTTAPVLSLRGIRKSYNLGEANETEVLHGIDLDLWAGEFCAVVGPSGSGKSTLLNIVGLLDRPTQGALTMTGQETTRMCSASMTRMATATLAWLGTSPASMRISSLS